MPPLPAARRYGNPTTRACEEKIRELEGAEDCLVSSSGMNAATTVGAGCGCCQPPAACCCRQRGRTAAGCRLWTDLSGREQPDKRQPGTPGWGQPLLFSMWVPEQPAVAVKKHAAAQLLQHEPLGCAIKQLSNSVQGIARRSGT